MKQVKEWKKSTNNLFKNFWARKHYESIKSNYSSLAMIEKVSDSIKQFLDEKSKSLILNDQSRL